MTRFRTDGEIPTPELLRRANAPVHQRVTPGERRAVMIAISIFALYVAFMAGRHFEADRQDEAFAAQEAQR